MTPQLVNFHLPDPGQFSLAVDRTQAGLRAHHEWLRCTVAAAASTRATDWRKASATADSSAAVTTPPANAVAASLFTATPIRSGHRPGLHQLLQRLPNRRTSNLSSPGRSDNRLPHISGRSQIRAVRRRHDRGVLLIGETRVHELPSPGRPMPTSPTATRATTDVCSRLHRLTQLLLAHPPAPRPRPIELQAATPHPRSHRSPRRGQQPVHTSRPRLCAARRMNPRKLHACARRRHDIRRSKYAS